MSSENLPRRPGEDWRAIVRRNGTKEFPAAFASNPVLEASVLLAMVAASGDFVLLHGRFSGHGRPAAWIAADIVRMERGVLAEHWDVIQDEATQAQSRSGLPMFGDSFPA